ncbi:CD209 antigen-like protein A isoform X2 [Pyxicephalus adspersus]|uniref:CD209 antigen-like protein A isoform X2 n=1 Tax=Pyxicephalus adspersus TaxID=30357 RepID=UPI003B5BBE66
MLENYEKMKTGQSAMFETSSHLETRIKKIESSLNIGTADPLCEMDWIHYGLNCYNLSLDAKTWNSAKKDCEEKGAHLVVIDGEDEMKFLDVFPHASEYLWIGLTKSGEWKWVDGSSLNKAFWAKGQPNNYKGKQNCGKLHAGLHDRDCPEASRYICEKPLSSLS